MQRQHWKFAVFFVFGLLSAETWSQFGWRHAAYAAISLTVVRMLPVVKRLNVKRFARLQQKRVAAVAHARCIEAQHRPQLEATTGEFVRASR